MFRVLSRLLIVGLLLSALGTSAAQASGGGKRFITSAVEGPNNTLTFPLYQGISGGQSVYYLCWTPLTASSPTGTASTGPTS